jgi:uncharacterized repeat protein (TIGR04076 family)
MTDIVWVEVVRVRGRCNADLREGDLFRIEGLHIISEGHKKSCQVAFASLSLNLGRLKVQGDPLYISCPDPGTGEGGNVIFKITRIKRNDKDQH